MKDLNQVAEIISCKDKEDLNFPISRELFHEIISIIDEIPGWKGNYHPEDTVGSVVGTAKVIRGMRKVFIFNTTIITGKIKGGKYDR